MASTYSPALRLELMATGDQSGTWGDTTNTNLGTLLEQAITGYLSVAQGDVANLTLTTTNGASDQARNAVIRITGALTATRNVVIQTAAKLYTIANDTTGGFSIVVKTAAGTGVSVPPGAMVNVYSDGTNAVQAANYWTGSIGGIAYLDAGATVGPNFDLFRDSTSPAVSDILGRVTFNGRDNAANKQEYASIETVIVDPIGATEDGQLDVYVVKAGARTKFLSMTATATAFTGAAAYSTDADLTISSVDAGAAAGPTLDLYRNSATPAAADLIGKIAFTGEDSAGNTQEYAAIRAKIADPTSTSEDGALLFSVAKAGASTNYLYLGANAAGTDTADVVGLPLGQLSFPATQNPSSDANTLDDYEEGTWTPALQFGGGATGMTGTFSGSYTKIGRLVFARGSITLTAKGSSTGTATIENFPFSASANTPAVIGQAALFTGLTGTLQGFITGTAITLRQSNSAGNASIDNTVFQNTTVFNFSATYEV